MHCFVFVVVFLILIIVHLEAFESFKVWRKLSPKVVDHETSPAHLVAFDGWKDMAVRLEADLTIDRGLQLEIAKDAAKWRDILKQILDGILIYPNKTSHLEDIARNYQKNLILILEI